MDFTSGVVANNLMRLELTRTRQPLMTKLINLHEAWLKNSDYKKAYEFMQIEYELEWQRLSSISTTNKSKRPIQLHDRQIQTRRSTDPH